MTKNQFKKRIQSFSYEELIEFLLELYGKSTSFKEVMGIFLDPEEGKKILDKYKKKLYKAFTPKNYSLSGAKGIVKEFESVCPDERLRAEFYIAYAVYAADMSSTFGDFGNAFYNSIYDMGAKGIKYLESHGTEYEELTPLIEEMIEACGYFGYGVQDDLRMEYRKVLNKLNGDGINGVYN